MIWQLEACPAAILCFYPKTPELSCRCSTCGKKRRGGKVELGGVRRAARRSWVWGFKGEGRRVRGA